MTVSISFTVPGRIGGKGRARSTRAGQHYTPAKTRIQEGVVRHFAAQAMRGLAIFDGPVRLRLAISINHPKSWSKKKKAATLWVTVKPDGSNVLKSVEDAMNNIVYHDDAQIADIHIRRTYSPDVEHVHVHVETLVGRYD